MCRSPYPAPWQSCSGDRFRSKPSVNTIWNSYNSPTVIPFFSFIGILFSVPEVRHTDFQTRHSYHFNPHIFLPSLYLPNVCLTSSVWPSAMTYSLALLPWTKITVRPWGILDIKCERLQFSRGSSDRKVDDSHTFCNIGFYSFKEPFSKLKTFCEVRRIRTTIVYILFVYPEIKFCYRGDSWSRSKRLLIPVVAHPICFMTSYKTGNLPRHAGESTISPPVLFLPFYSL